MPVYRRTGEAASGDGSAPAAEPEGKYWLSLPCVVEFLSLSKWPDSSSRQTGTVMLFRESGLWKAWVHDRDALQGLFVSAGSLQGLLREIEEAVGTGKGDWRADKKGAKGKG